MKPLTNKCTLPEPWYVNQARPAHQLDELSAFSRPKRDVRTAKQAEAVLTDAGFTPAQIAALRDVGAIKS